MKMTTNAQQAIKAKNARAKKAAPKKPAARKPETDATGVIPSTRSVVKAGFKKAYGKNGKCGDQMSMAMPAKRADVEAVCKQNGIDAKERWGHLNDGMARMNAGNVLRRYLKDGIDVKIGTHTMKGASGAGQ